MSFGVFTASVIKSRILFLLAKQVALVFAKIGPWVGLFTVYAAIQVNQDNPWSEVWRIGMSVALAIFVTLVGMIYQNLNKRVENLETAAKTDFVPRREYETKHEDLEKYVERIERAVDRIESDRRPRP